MLIELAEAAGILQDNDNFLILAHSKPDGDTLGSAYALQRALITLGKKAFVKCGDPVPSKFSFLVPHDKTDEFEPDCIIAVDIADTKLLGILSKKYCESIDLCIDHHRSNNLYAKKTLLDAGAAANGEIIYKLILELGITPDKEISNAIFTAITSDTGGFRYADVSAQTHRIAADLIEFGAEHSHINRIIFETKSRARMNVDRLMLETMRFDFDGCCATIFIPASLKEEYGIGEDDLDGISSLPRTIEGVYVGITLRDCGDQNSFRISLRSQSPFNSSAVCVGLGGGGHKNAAGVTLEGSLDEVRETLLKHVRAELERKGIWTA